MFLCLAFLCSPFPRRLLASSCFSAKVCIAVTMDGKSRKTDVVDAVAGKIDVVLASQTGKAASVDVLTGKAASVDVLTSKSTAVDGKTGKSVAMDGIGGIFDCESLEIELVSTMRFCSFP